MYTPLENTIIYRIINRMKVTAILPDELINEIKQYSSGKTITESLTIALKDWIALQKIKQLTQKIKREPLKFKSGFTAYKARSVNRKFT